MEGEPPQAHEPEPEPESLIEAAPATEPAPDFGFSPRSEAEPEAEAEPEGPVVAEPQAGRQDTLMLLASSPERISDLLHGVDATRGGYRHGPAFPTMTELVAHLALSGAGVESVLRAAAEEGATEIDTTPALDPPAQSVRGSIKEQVAAFTESRRGAIEFLRNLPAEAWERPIHAQRLGEVTLLEICRLLVTHEFGHIIQLRNLIALVPEAEPVAAPSPDGHA